MKLVSQRSKRWASGLCVLWLSLAARPAAQAAPMSVTPADPMLSAGQTLQFTASGAITPTAVSAGGEYTCVRLPDGTAQCTGRNQFGQHGNGTLDNSSVLDPVGGITTATHVPATGYGHTCALLTDATMRCWGENRQGQLGNGTTADPGTAHPVAVSGISGATAFTTGAYHTCARLGNGTLKCWGRNGDAQLGNGTYTDSSTPVPVSGITTAAMVSGGGAHTCAVLSDGTVWCWGDNRYGQLGDGTTLGKTTPVPVSGITGAVAVSAGWDHTCALLGDSSVQCWGENASGQLGDGTTTRRTTPVPVSAVTGAVAVTAGWWHHSCALLGDGTVRCWGDNQWGQLGNGTTTDSPSPVTMSGTGVTWTSSNTAVATIDATGRATGVGAGTTTITATDASGASASTTLSAASDSTFAGWTGCDTVSGATCTLTVDSGRTATAAFDLKRFVLTVKKTGLVSGQGSVTSNPPGIDCGADCAETYTSGTVVTLTASPSMLFGSWSGCDSVSGTTCTVTVSAARSVAAGFLP